MGVKQVFGAHPRLPFSAAVRAGEFVFISGQGPIDPSTGVIVGSDVVEQTRYTLQRVAAALGEAGATLEEVVKVSVHLADMALFDGFNSAYSEFFPSNCPARTTVASGMKGILIEIDTIAYSPEA